jgi:hypothetical protein
LCAFLAWVPDSLWDRVSESNLLAILTRDRITEFTSAAGMPSHSVASRDEYRVQLVRILEGLLGLRSVRNDRKNSTPKAAVSFWPRVAGQGPFVVLAAAYQAKGDRLHANTWIGLWDQLAAGWDLAAIFSFPSARTTGVSRASGTLRDVQAAAALLRTATLPAREVSTASSPETVSTEPKPGGRRSTRAEELRAARAAIRAGVAPTSPAVVDEVTPGAVALPDVTHEWGALLDGWHPADVDDASWVLVRDAFTAAVVAYEPSSKANLRNVRSIVASFVLWLVQRPERSSSDPLTVDELLALSLIDSYLVGPLANQPDGSRATVRSVLRRVVRRLDPSKAAEKIAYRAVQAPYTEGDCARFVLLARNQPTDPLRRSLSAMVALGLGAGLGAEDQKTISPQHIREIDLGGHGTGLAIDVPGTRARTVVVREEYEDLLREALDLHHKARRGNATPLYGVKPTRRNGANRVAQKSVTATGGGVDIDAARLRSTWLVACMSAAVPLGILLHASGLRTPRTLADLLPYCPPADPDAVAALLRSLGGEAAS